MESPKITIVTASFNSGKTIAQTIASVLNQSYKNIEYLIIDGASADSTIDIVKTYEPLFSGRLKWISEKDGGIYYAWNKAVLMASGDWICFVGSDDILMADAIEQYVTVINRDISLNFVSSQIKLVTSDLRSIRVSGKPWGEEMKTYSCISHVGSMHHKSLFKLKGKFDTAYSISADYDFLLRCFDIIKPGYIPVVTALVREGGVSTNKISGVANETLRIKIANKCKTPFACRVDYYIAILKFYVRTKLINKLVTFASKSSRRS